MEECSEIEKQNPQTAASNELTGVRRSKRQQVVCCKCRQNSRHLRESSNCPWLDKKQVVSWTNEGNEMWQRSCVEWIPFITTLKERKKQEVMSKMAYLKVPNERECVLRVECRKYRKNGSMSVLGGTICRSCVSSLVGRGLCHMQISAS